MNIQGILRKLRITEKKVKVVDGIELIDDVIGRFTVMVNELDRGMANCQNERVSIKSQIDSLRQKDAILNSSIDRADTIATNLRKLIGE